MCTGGQKKPTHRRKNTPQNFQKNPTETEEEEALGQNQTGVCSREIQERRTLAKKLLVSRETHLKKPRRKLFKKKEKTEKNLGNLEITK